MNDALTFNPDELVRSCEVLATDLHNLRAERDRLRAECDSLAVEIAERKKQLAAQNQRETLAGMSAIEFLEHIAKAGDAEKRLRTLADNLAVVERTKSEAA